MKFAAEIIADRLTAVDNTIAVNMCVNRDFADSVAEEIIAALAAEGYQISAGQAPATGGGHAVEVKPAKHVNKSKARGQETA